MSVTSDIVAALKNSPLTYRGMSLWLGGSRYLVTWRIVRSKVAA